MAGFTNKKPDANKIFPSLNTRGNRYQLPSRVKNKHNVKPYKNMKIKVGKSNAQADQILCETLKCLKFCCSDVTTSWDIRETVVDYCLGSLAMLSDFVKHLQNKKSVTT